MDFNKLQRERRYFPRVPFRVGATLLTPHNRYHVHVIDLSFSGALVALLDDGELQAAEEVILTLVNDDGDTIKMQGKLAHQKDHYLGLECRASSIDNQARLRDLLCQHIENAENQAYH